jgi:hypothetical protein
VATRVSKGVPVIDPIEIQRRLFHASSGLAEKIGRDIGSYTVALLSVTGSGQNEVLRFRGSGSLVSIGDSAYILTAAHGWEKFENALGIGLTLDKENVDHRFFMPVKSIMAFGPKEIPSWPDPWGPDMRLLKIPPEYADELKKVKKFYTLTADIPEPPNVNSLEVWLLIGSPQEQSTITPKHASLTMNAIFATIRSNDTHAGLDYVDLNMDPTFPGIPKRFFGVSGGGFWSALIYGSDDGELHWILTLVGMACWQPERTLVRCLGAKSIRSLISEVL